jgi:hypothetical protein
MKGPVFRLVNPKGAIVGSLQVEAGELFVTRMVVYLPMKESEVFFSKLAIHNQLPAGYTFRLSTTET